MFLQFMSMFFYNLDAPCYSLDTPFYSLDTPCYSLHTLFYSRFLTEMPGSVNFLTMAGLRGSAMRYRFASERLTGTLANPCFEGRTTQLQNSKNSCKYLGCCEEWRRREQSALPSSVPKLEQAPQCQCVHHYARLCQAVNQRKVPAHAVEWQHVVFEYCNTP